MWPPFLDHVSAAQARRSRRTSSGPRSGGTSRRACVISHEMSRGYVLEYPVDDPDEDDDDDSDEDDEGDEDEDSDGEDVETWQVSCLSVPLKDALCLTSATELA